MAIVVKTKKQEQDVSGEEVLQLLAQGCSINAKVATLQGELGRVYQQLANVSCPYKEGDKLITDTGLGVKGLVVGSILPSAEPSLTNRWALQTWSLSKSGEVTQRGVLIQEASAPILGLRRSS